MYDVLIFLEGVGATVAGMLVLPLVLWTVLAFLFYALACYLPLSYAAQHHSLRLVLLSLPLGVGLAVLIDVPPAVLPVALPVLNAVPGVVSEGASTARTLAWSFVGLGAGCAVASGVALIALIRLFTEATRLWRFHRTLAGDTDPALEDVVSRVQGVFNLRLPVVVQYHDAPAVPVTYGWRTPYVVLPRTLRGNPEATEMALAHELAHVVRRDYAWQSLLQTSRALFAFHPLVHLLQRRLDTSRELACDALVLEHCAFSRKAYARLLYTLTPVQPLAPLLVQPILRSSHQLKNRVLAMKATYPAPRFYHRLVPALMLILCVSAMACSDVVSQDATPEPATEAAAAKTEAEPSVTLRLENVKRSGSEVSGRVVSAETGKALPGVNVRVIAGDEVLDGVTNLRGDFVIRNVTAAYKTVEAQFVDAKTATMQIPQ